MRFVLLFLLLAALSSRGQQAELQIAEADLKKLPTVPSLYSGKDTFAYYTVADTNVLAYMLPPAFKKPKAWLKREAMRKQDSANNAREADSLDLVRALAMIDTAKQFYTLRVAGNWCIDHYAQAFPYLVARLSVKKKTGLENSADLIIMERIFAGEMKFYGHGWSVDEDLYTVAGRASWILNELTGEKFAVVRMRSVQAETEGFKTLWKGYLGGLGK